MSKLADDAKRILAVLRRGGTWHIDKISTEVSLNHQEALSVLEHLEVTEPDVRSLPGGGSWTTDKRPSAKTYN